MLSREKKGNRDHSVLVYSINVIYMLNSVLLVTELPHLQYFSNECAVSSEVANEEIEPWFLWVSHKVLIS